MIGVIVSVFSIGATLNAMNKGLETFQRLPNPIAFSLDQLPDGVQNKGHFTRDRISLTNHRHISYHSHTASSTTPASYILLNAIGSTTLADGKYLYNPATGQIEVQWIQGIGSEKAAAPQGRLMATVINGILSRKLPWSLVLLGVALVIVVELLGVRSLTFAVGAYLSIGTTLAIFVGGVMRWMVDRALRQRTHPRSTSGPPNPKISPGSLYASGLIAAGGIVGLLGVCTQALRSRHRPTIPRFSDHNPLHHDWVSVLMFALLAFSLYYFARKPLKNI